MLTLFLLSTTASRAADYTGDGIDDLVVGVPWEDVSADADGAVEVIRGSTSGLTAMGDALIHQGTAGVPSNSNSSEVFGYGLGAGDVDGNGVDDLIVGGPFDLVGGVDAGAVWRLELRATRTSFSVIGAQFFAQDIVGVSDSGESYDQFGWAIAVADFNDDGYDDVVVGIAGEDVGTIADAGAVEFLPGSATGLTTTGQLYFDQNVPGVAGVAESNDRFGYSLTAGDFNGDDYADLAIGVPWEDWTGTDEGSVHVMYGGSTGPQVTSPDDDQWTAGRAGSVAGTLRDGNLCGWALTTGDFDGDGYDELAIGCREYDVSGGRDGAVLAVYGSASGLDSSDLWDQDVTGVKDVAEDLDFFGQALTSGDYDDDGYGDLAIGVLEDTGSFTKSGAVQVLLGSSTGLTDVGDLLLAQDTGGIVAGTPGDYDWFGAALTSGDYNDDGFDDLAVGAQYDSETGATYAGVVNVFYGSTSGPSTVGDQLFSQDTVGIEDSAEDDDQFGISLR